MKEQVSQLPEDAEVDLPDITSYIVIRQEEFNRLKRLEENLKKNIEKCRSSSNSFYRFDVVKLLESLDK